MRFNFASHAAKGHLINLVITVGDTRITVNRQTMMMAAGDKEESAKRYETKVQKIWNDINNETREQVSRDSLLVFNSR